MNRQEHLLTIGMEECAEVAQRISKALRFGLDEVQPNADGLHPPDGNPTRQSNLERIRAEFTDLLAVLDMAGIIAIDRQGRVFVDAQQRDAKVRKVERYLVYAAQQGTLAP